MDLLITPHNLRGRIDKIYSKSYGHRFIILYFISTLKNKNNIDKTSLKKWILQKGNDDLKETYTAMSTLANHNSTAIFEIEESGSTFRMIFSISLYILSKATFYLGKSLYERIDLSEFDFINSDNIHIENGKDDKGYFIAFSKHNHFIFPEYFYFDYERSSQFISGLLLGSTLSNQNLTIEISKDFPSLSYINITLDTLSKVGIRYEIVDLENSFSITILDRNFSISFIDIEDIIENDYSLLANWQGANFIQQILNNTQHNFLTFNLDKTSVQEDFKFKDILKNIQSNTELSIDCNNTPDIFPILCLCIGMSRCPFARITNIQRLKYKESNRIKSTLKVLDFFNITYQLGDNDIKVFGNNKITITKNSIDTFNDHRICMMIAIGSIACDQNFIIKNANVVNKSYPKFWETFEKLGGKFAKI